MIGLCMSPSIQQLIELQHVYFLPQRTDTVQLQVLISRILCDPLSGGRERSVSTPQMVLDMTSATDSSMSWTFPPLSPTYSPQF